MSKPDYVGWLRHKVVKKDGTPFFSGYYQNTVKGVGCSTIGFRQKMTFVFYEDSSEVQCDYCELLSKDEYHEKD